jgi:hypothetical protein
VVNLESRLEVLLLLLLLLLLWAGGQSSCVVQAKRHVHNGLRPFGFVVVGAAQAVVGEVDPVGVVE